LIFRAGGGLNLLVLPNYGTDNSLCTNVLGLSLRQRMMFKREISEMIFFHI